jgi:hypothetical protein
MVPEAGRRPALAIRHEMSIDRRPLRRDLDGTIHIGRFDPMRYLILLHGDEAAEARLSADERRRIVEGHLEFARRAPERGYKVSGDSLETSAKAFTIRKGKVTDGPFAETKEQVGGYYIVECGGRDEVIELAREIPDSPGLVIDIRELSGM